MPPRGGKICKGPRSLAGGYSARHDERSAARGVKKQYAASWNDATASTFLEELKKVASDASGHIQKKVVLDLFRNPLGMADVVKQACARLVARDKELVIGFFVTSLAKARWGPVGLDQRSCVKRKLWNLFSYVFLLMK